MTDFDRLAPLYAQVKARIARQIADGEIAEGEFLPAEPELCAAFGVSRITLRRAVSELCDDGILIRQRGRGTVVARRKIRQALVSLSGFVEALGNGHAVAHVVLSVEHSVVAPAAAAALGAGDDARLAQVVRLVSLDGRPFTLETLVLDEARFPCAVAPVAAGASFLATLRDTAGASVAAAERTIDVGFASMEERRHLGIGPSDPVYRMDKTLFADDGRPISWSHLVTPTHLITYSLRT